MNLKQLIREQVKNQLKEFAIGSKEAMAYNIYNRMKNNESIDDMNLTQTQLTNLKRLYSSIHKSGSRNSGTYLQLIIRNL